MVTTNYRYKGQTLPKTIQKNLDDYMFDGANPGSFLARCLSNDLMRAVEAANNWERELIPVIAAYIYQKLPAYCLGNWNTVVAWKGVDAYEAECDLKVNG